MTYRPRWSGTPGRSIWHLRRSILSSSLANRIEQRELRAVGGHSSGETDKPKPNTRFSPPAFRVNTPANAAHAARPRRTTRPATRTLVDDLPRDAGGHAERRIERDETARPFLYASYYAEAGRYGALPEDAAIQKTAKRRVSCSIIVQAELRTAS